MANGSRVEAYNDYKSQVWYAHTRSTHMTDTSLIHFISTHSTSRIILSTSRIYALSYGHTYCSNNTHVPLLLTLLQALHLAAQWGHPDVCRLLIDHGAVVDARTKVNWTPLHNACREGNSKPYQRILSIRTINNTYYQHALSTHLINTSCKNTLATCPIDLISTVSIHLVLTINTLHSPSTDAMSCRSYTGGAGVVRSRQGGSTSVNLVRFFSPALSHQGE